MAPARRRAAALDVARGTERVGLVGAGGRALSLTAVKGFPPVARRSCGVPSTAEPPPGLTRRRFLGGAITLVCAPPILQVIGCSSPPPATSPPSVPLVDGWPVPPGTTLAAEDYARLSALMDALFPGDDQGPGAVAAGAPWYLDQLFGAFRTDPPRIFAGGPYSGRHGGADGFSQFQRLTRVEELGWRTFIEGSQGIPEREWNGPQKGLVQLYTDGLGALEAAAQAKDGAPFTTLSSSDRRALVNAADPDFIALAWGHTIEGTLGDPVYGGNLDRAGWRLVDYEGDRQPIGYSAVQMAHPEEG